MKITVIYNPVAGGGASRLLARFLARLEEGGADLTVYHTRGPGDATDWLLARDDQGDCVVAVGGDGTTNEVINGLVPGVSLGILATGTANVLATELKLPRHPEKAADIVLEGRDLEVWPARLGERRFVMMAGIGYDAWVVEGADMALKERIGKGAYVISMIREIARYGSVQYRLLIDGRPYDCFSAVLTNGRHYGGSFVMSRLADITRPSLQVLMFQKTGRLSLLRFLLGLLFRRMETMNGVVSLSARRVELTGPEGEPIQVDGDHAGELPAEIRVDDQSIRVRVSERVGRRLGNG